MEEDKINNFLVITAVEDADVARQFLDMAGGDVDTAISLYFEHGVSGLPSGGADAGAGTSGASSSVAHAESDSALAERLQQEAYQEPQTDVRPPDEARHETLAETHVFPTTYGGIGGSFGSLRHHSGNVAQDMFDNSTPQGIFNQRMDFDYSDDSSSEGSSSSSLSEFNSNSDDDDEYEYVEEDVVEVDDDGNITERKELVRRLKNPITKEARLAMLFRPPFDIMSKVNLDRAKLKARKKKRWIMINIQDSGVFQCQALNRDIWSNKRVKRLIKKNFIFLQYQFESRNAEPYVHFYGLKSKEELPHIAILDPLTGERLKQWDSTVPRLESFLDEVEKFLKDFSLEPGSKNPLIKQPTPDLDPTTLSEEQQMELAIRQSLGAGEQEVSPSNNERNTDEVSETEIADAKEEEKPSTGSLFDQIEPINHEEPQNEPGKTTRIQIRTGDGRRMVRRFNLTDTVRNIYEVIKAKLDGFADCQFILSNHQRENLIEKLSLTIAEAELGNSSLLVEKE
ncbi:uncharacterized protein GVI51_M01221 [Nakaseomyces glabratus]|uniref:UBX domain-containing protein n=1 Tax=Candida glabrata (strain ATCC 2001 / BCRC 20586 / JCM 3761 / NBRC 0622 / NRRL Y-65 / CBS 138) TaxID=284593 RepID=Q6FK42_CANGA|nr:uncharacterized protein CAGL0M01320g [Nakaseomyces glabratus]KAH7593583.1 Thioredoxin-like [Nakaseomyces glabratus]KAH7600034.1 Thioredoxin-like [Nakaseomyces glabratus]QHS69083.1 uncharacterized protein GVI51_M01221 [Nakaseomyces glabratus]CAG62378.1 unnamed protein product [Nakaseomyces glabratus]|eukprot:XP_449402.1 uncharacterized protein CAGL0M01320g [[Candida] glabrata]